MTRDGERQRYLEVRLGTPRNQPWRWCRRVLLGGAACSLVMAGCTVPMPTLLDAGTGSLDAGTRSDVGEPDGGADSPPTTDAASDDAGDAPSSDVLADDVGIDAFAPDTGPACVADCAMAGATRCASAVSQETCADRGSGCLTWGAAVACTCASDRCVSACDTCAPRGGTRCASLDVEERCGDFDLDGCATWSAPRTCTGSCTGSSCSGCSDECLPGEARCMGAITRQTCGQFDVDACLEWGADMACTGTCSGTMCTGCGVGAGTDGAPCCAGGCCLGALACSAGTCRCPDADGDGHRARECYSDDCDDSQPGTFPGATEVCDGRDNNCNARIDEGVTRPCTTACATTGTQTCMAGAWLTCRNATCSGSAETCNGIDDDGNGSIDETRMAPLGAVMPCTAACGVAGLVTSTAPACDFSGACVPYSEAAGTNCDDTIDNDCDGLFDCADADCASTLTCADRCG